MNHEPLGESHILSLPGSFNFPIFYEEENMTEDGINKILGTKAHQHQSLQTCFAPSLSSLACGNSLHLFISSLLKEHKCHDAFHDKPLELTGIENLYHLLISMLPASPMDCRGYQFLVCQSTHLGARNFHEKLLILLQSKSFKGHLPCEKWTLLQYQWIVWKLSGYRKLSLAFHQNAVLPDSNDFISFPELSICEVMRQLEIRAFREFDAVNRPLLRKIIEKDEACARPMCLFVSDINYSLVERFRLGLGNSLEFSNNWLFYLSDGYYAIPVICKNNLSFEYIITNLLLNGKLFAGQKLLICNSQIMMKTPDGLDMTCPKVLHSILNPPGLNSIPPFFLKFDLNCLKRAYYWQHLGIYRSSLICSSLSSVLPFGGVIPGIVVSIIYVSSEMYVVRNRACENSSAFVILSEAEKDHFIQHLEDTLPMLDIQCGQNPFDDISISPAIFCYAADFTSARRLLLLKYYNADENTVQELKRAIKGEKIMLVTDVMPVSTGLWSDSMCLASSTSRTRLKSMELSPDISSAGAHIKELMRTVNMYLLATKSVASLPVSRSINLPLIFCKRLQGQGSSSQYLFRSTDGCTVVIEYKPQQFTTLFPEIFKENVPAFVPFRRIVKGDLVFFKDLTFVHLDDRADVYLFAYSEKSSFSSAPKNNLSLVAAAFKLRNWEVAVDEYRKLKLDASKFTEYIAVELFPST